ncbi:MAG: AAA family ATPase, partial [Planctomycetaceae bacterium]|nr:AAA family ATPase [Planctomycetaceae bacterium]
ILTRISTQMLLLWESQELDWDSRCQEGFIRECHGDLHLGNMALLDERVMIFDGIDFNPQLRWIDVMSEVAFLVMDLEHCHDRSLAYRFLNHYCELTGDYAGLSTLPFYVAYRALVRAKVKGIRWDQEFELIPADEQEDMSELLRLALSYSSAHLSKLMITHGFSGSGKSTRTQTLVEQLGAIRIRSDVERKRLFQGQSTFELYSAQATEHTYQKLLTLAEIILRAGFPVILDATFLKHQYRKMFHELADKCGAEFQILSYHAPLEVLKARVKNRAQHGGDVSDADLAVLEAQYRNHDPLTAAEQPFVQQIDTTVD